LAQKSYNDENEEEQDSVQQGGMSNGMTSQDDRVFKRFLLRKTVLIKRFYH
jgi:hypothetical protein